MSNLRGAYEISWPWRGYADYAVLTLDVTTARKYSFPEDGSQTANQVFEVGGGGAIFVKSNVAPLEQGDPLLERVMSRSSIQSQFIMQALEVTGEQDLVLYSYAPVVPSATLGANDPNMPLGSYTTGSLVRVRIPVLAPNGEEVYDPRFPEGMDQVWRITGYTVNPVDQGDATVTITFAQPPITLAEAVAAPV